jgi:pre-mRNA-splicing factor RBM22/SLT11
LAKKIINKIQDFKIPQPPEDDSISTLFIGDIDEETSKEKIHDKFLPFGKITGIRLIPSKKCGFICFQ